MDAVAADGGTETGAECAFLKRLDHVVVCAGLERIHIIGTAVAVAEDEQWKPGIDVANLTTGCDVLEARHGEGQNNDLILEGSETRESGRSSGSDLQIEAKRLESA